MILVQNRSVGYAYIFCKDEWLGSETKFLNKLSSTYNRCYKSFRLNVYKMLIHISKLY